MQDEVSKCKILQVIPYISHHPIEVSRIPLLEQHQDHFSSQFLTYPQDLQKATASEPLTLSEEYAMQKSWRNDADKLTFIVHTGLGPADYTSQSFAGNTKSNYRSANSTSITPPFTMIGDVNLFLYPVDDEDQDVQDGQTPSSPTNIPTSTPQPQPVLGELEIMIASKTAQGKGMGKQILLPFLWYILATLDCIMAEYHSANGSGKERSVLKYLRVKIGHENVRSIRLFESVGFAKVGDGEPNYFGEVELRLDLSEGLKRDVEGRMELVPFVVGYS